MKDFFSWIITGELGLFSVNKPGTIQFLTKLNGAGFILLAPQAFIFVSLRSTKIKSGGFKRILLIDDALGSGATMNEVAIKIRKNFQANQIFALAIVGSYKGFDVLNVV